VSLVLEAKNVSLSYDLGKEKTDEKRHWIFKDISFRMKSGELILMTGPSGCGKSSLMNMVNGVIPHLKKAYVRGEVCIQGKKITDSTVRERTKFVGSVFQNPREQIIFDDVSAEIVFPMENIGETPQRMKEKLTTLLDMTGLIADAKTATLSDGEKQKLMTACTLAMGQNILLLDEPLANMDVKSAIELLSLLRRLAKEEGYAILLIEHRQEMVLPYVDRVFLLKPSDLPNVEMTLEYLEEAEVYQKHICQESHSVDRRRNWIANDETNDDEEVDHVGDAKAEKVSPQEVLFSVNNVDYYAGKRPLLKNFSWQVKRGESWVVLGENGCGKTTLLNLLIGFEKPARGEITWSYSKKDQRKKIGYVLQNPDYQLFMPKVRDELYLNAKSSDFVEELIQLFDLNWMLDRHPLSLSEGQKRKLGFACMIAQEPEVLFLDEPTVGLDTASMDQLLYALALLKERSGIDLTTISVSHDKRAIPYLGSKFLSLS
jgi:energy-coupling factor transporter ATP-binding protein EcfA2